MYILHFQARTSALKDGRLNERSNYEQEDNGFDLYSCYAVSYTHLINTLAGYIHYRLTGKRQVGIGEASGIFPVDSTGYNTDYIKKVDVKTKGVPI